MEDSLSNCTSRSRGSAPARSHRRPEALHAVSRQIRQRASFASLKDRRRPWGCLPLRPPLSQAHSLRLQENPSHNAYRISAVTVYYPWHPLRGQTLVVHRRVRDRRGDTVFCRLPDGIVTAIPVWMTDPAAADIVLGPPQVSVDALIELQDLLTTLKSRRKGEPHKGSRK